MNPLHALDIAHHIHPQTNLDAHMKQGPFVLTRGEGVYVFDDQDKPYIDGLAGLWSASLGYSETRLADVAYEQLKRLPYASSFAHRAHGPVIELADRLIGMSPAALTRVFFANSGSEAIDTAAKLVWYYQNAMGRPKKKSSWLAKKPITVQRSSRGVSLDCHVCTGSSICLSRASSGCQPLIFGGRV